MQRYIHIVLFFFFLAHLPITFEITVYVVATTQKNIWENIHLYIYIHWFPLKHRYHSLL
jgi:hypothetical protein